MDIDEYMAYLSSEQLHGNDKMAKNYCYTHNIDDAYKHNFEGKNSYILFEVIYIKLKIDKAIIMLLK